MAFRLSPHQAQSTRGTHASFAVAFRCRVQTHQHTLSSQCLARIVWSCCGKDTASSGEQLRGIAPPIGKALEERLGLEQTNGQRDADQVLALQHVVADLLHPVPHDAMGGIGTRIPSHMRKQSIPVASTAHHVTTRVTKSQTLADKRCSTYTLCLASSAGSLSL